MPSMSIPTQHLLLGGALAAASLALGYQLGARSQTPAPPAPPATLEPDAKAVEVQEAEEEGSDEDDDDDEDLADGNLAEIKPGFMEPCKMVLIVRTDLKMTQGKISAQCGHATLACYKALMKTNPKLVQHWERTGQAKIALKAKSEDELLELEAIAKSLNLCARSIQDAGHTQVAAGSRTVLGIGPAPVALINQVTGHLRLL
ncbi:PTH2-domain-containing protein [Athelia psychrophila]|uniref:peptidyl-tRNA hydrolase n=1 Tax=Athelia psychrophila TaxID=1759441 RepID=A0A166V2X9_9AGAM|nr:PTH2-domain-containing protein [Fibularhizoctonia sp. CBS 109695]